MKKLVGTALVLSLVAANLLVMPAQAKKKKVKLNKKKVTLEIGDTTTLKVKNSKKKVKWSTSNKKVATVKKGKVTAKKKGTATITAKVARKKYKCKVKVILPKNYYVLEYGVDVCENTSYKISDLLARNQKPDAEEDVYIKDVMKISNKIKWKCDSEKVKISGNSIVASEAGVYHVYGRPKDGVESKNMISIEINVVKNTLTVANAEAVNAIEIVRFTDGSTVRLTDVSKIQTLIAKMTEAQYQFDFKTANPIYGEEYESRKDSILYSITFCGSELPTMMVWKNVCGNYICNDANDVMAYLASLMKVRGAFLLWLKK